MTATRVRTKLRRWDEVLARLPDGPCSMAEIGVWQCKLSRAVLSAHPSVRMLLVDPWQAGQPGTSWLTSGSKMAHYPQAEYERAYEQARALVRAYPERVTVSRTTSTEAAMYVPDASLDLVFIDAEHSEAAVAADIAAWLPKVRPGGWIGGHDYMNPRHPGVEAAVQNAFIAADIETGHNSTWFVAL